MKLETQSEDFSFARFVHGQDRNNGHQISSYSGDTINRIAVTVGIRKRDMSDYQMVVIKAVFEW